MSKRTVENFTVLCYSANSMLGYDTNEKLLQSVAYFFSEYINGFLALLFWKTSAFSDQSI
ncbi:hypothetical protein V1478_010273 [Vespula squamosa]|uniref:Uncharacterized protein n=1 Tax=Vespula squamosa TaxID=30214 RepID=A0ABD2AK53_VESSQ